MTSVLLVGYKEASAGAFPLYFITLIIDNRLKFKSLCNCILSLGDLSLRCLFLAFNKELDILIERKLPPLCSWKISVFVG